MIKTFEQFNYELLNEWASSPYDSYYFISPDSKAYVDAEKFFKAETGKDLKSPQFSWVFNNNNINDSICPPKFIVALMSTATAFKNYLTVVSYISDTIGSLYYHTGLFGVTTDSDKPYSPLSGTWSFRQDITSQNSKIVYNIWINYFYIPIKNAIQKKQFHTITRDGMANFVRVMTWDGEEQDITMSKSAGFTSFLASIRSGCELASRNEELMTAQQQQQVKQQIQTDQKSVKTVNTAAAKAKSSQGSVTPGAAKKFSGTFKNK